MENRQTSIGSVEVEGNRRTSEKFALSQIARRGRPGGQYSSGARVRQEPLANRRLHLCRYSRCGPSRQAAAVTSPVQVADLIVAVAEPKPFRLLYGALYDSGNGPGFIADLQNQNSLGGGRVLGLRTRVDGQTDEFRLYLTQPTLAFPPYLDHDRRILHA